MRKLILLFLVLFVVFGCTPLNESCNEEHFRHVAAIAGNGSLVAVFKLSQTIENTDEFCDPDFVKVRTYLSVENGTDFTLSFDFTLDLIDSLGVEIHEKDSIDKLAPGEETPTVLISREPIDLIGAELELTGENLVVE